MKEQFNQRAKALGDRLAIVIKKDKWEQPLRAEFEGLSFTPAQIAMIKAASTISSFIHDNVSFEFELAHTFDDGIGKMIMPLWALEFMPDEPTARRDALKAMMKLRAMLDDDIHNMRLIFGNKQIPDNIEQVLDRYETEFIPELEVLIDELSYDIGIDPKTIEINHEGCEHITKLPSEYNDLSQ